MYKFTLRQNTSCSDHIRSRANVMIRHLIQRNSPDPDYHNFTFDEAGKRINMTGRQIPEFIQHLEVIIYLRYLFYNYYCVCVFVIHYINTYFILYT